jgi:hypothetical protein
MVRRVGLGALGAILTLGFAAIPRANAQSVFDPTYTDFRSWSEARRLRALDAINRVGLSKEEIASILPLIGDLEESDNMRRNDIARLENDLLFSEPGEPSMETRIAEINTAHDTRVARIWDTISARIGADRAMQLRRLVDDSVVIDQTAYYNNADRLARIDAIFVDWDKHTQERIAAHEEYNRKLAEAVAAAEAHNQRVAREEAEAQKLREQALAAAQAQPPAVAVTPVETTTPAPVTTPAETAEVTQPAPQPARAFRSTPARQQQRRTRRVRGLG